MYECSLLRLGTVRLEIRSVTCLNNIEIKLAKFSSHGHKLRIYLSQIFDISQVSRDIVV